MYRIRGSYKTYARVERWAKKDKYTIGDFFVEEEKICNTLEDKVRDINQDGDLLDEGEDKIYGETAIPYTPEGFGYEAWIEDHPKFGMCLRVFGVNQFQGILVHTGNKPEHTLGCILVGYNTSKGMVLNSRKALDSIIKRLRTKVGMKEKFAFYVTDRKDDN